MKRKVVVLEGPDNLGKSTQAKKIWKWLTKNSEHELMSLHYSSISDSKKAFATYIKMFEIIDKNKDTNFILDRSHLGELVYSPMYRENSGSYFLYLEKTFDLVDYYLIVFIDEVNNIIAREDGDSLSKADPEKIKKEIDSFVHASVLSNIPKKLVINIEKKSPEDVFNNIQTFLTEY